MAGGEGRRCAGRDKGWMEFRGEALVVRRIRELDGQPWSLAISANRTLERYRDLGFPVFTDHSPDFPGPLAGIESALRAGFGDPLLTVPVDARDVPAAALCQLLEATDGGRVAAYAVDADGIQPLFAAWPAATLADVAAALKSPDASVRELQRRLRAVPVPLPLHRLGNINLPADLREGVAGYSESRPC